MLSVRTILPNTLELLKQLCAQPELKGMRLVGGTALALQYGHRQSIDLDFFGHLQVSTDDIVLMAHRLGNVTIINQSSTILQMELNGIKVDVVNYRCYDWIDAPIVENGITLASPKDIAALKINAIEGRGTRKDFVDVYLLLQHYSLVQILDFYNQKYPEHSEFRAILSLTYYDDAETQPMPKMLINDTWEQMKSSIAAAVKSYTK